jgi:cobalt-zinc-cadmium efflux system outer membrane protein
LSLLVALTVTVALAQGTPPQPVDDARVLAQVLARAREASPEVRLAARAVAEVEAGRVGQGVIFPTNPRLAGEVRRLGVPQGGASPDPLMGFGVTLDALVEVSGAGAGRVAEAGARLELARVELAIVTARSQAQAWRSWVEREIAARLEASALEARALQERLVDIARQRLTAGAAAAPEIAAVSLELAAASAQVEDARWATAQADFGLRSALDLAPDEPLPPPPGLGVPPPADDTDALTARARDRRPELKAAERRLAVLLAAEKRLALEAFPRVGGLLGYDAAPASGSYAFLGLSVELPVAQRNQGPLAVVRAQLATERERAAALARQLQRDVAAARSRYEAQRARWSVLDAQAVPAAQEHRDLVEAGWRAGRFDVFRLTTATRDLQRIRLERLQALRGTWDEWIELQRLSGGLN